MSFDAVVVGSGPNGLAAAIELARHGQKVQVLEAAGTVGGGVRSAELTEPGFIHDVCSAIHPFGVGSPFFKSLPLDVEWVHPPAPVAHPLDGGRAVLLERDLKATAEGLGRDGKAYHALFAPMVRGWGLVERSLLGPALTIPPHPVTAAQIGLPALLPTTLLCRLLFKAERAPALMAGIAGHSVISLHAPGSSAIAVILGLLGHRVGWPFPRGGAQKLADALAHHLRQLGGVIQTNTRVEELPKAKTVLLDTSVEAALTIAKDRIPENFQKALKRFRRGPGVFKLDWALDGPIPWSNPQVARAATVHLGGTLDEIARSEHQMAGGEHPDSPYVLLAQQSLFDPTRAPEGKQVAWAYCHVPNGSERDMTEAVTAQVERFAPGFTSRIRAVSTMTCSDFQDYNPNYLGGDIVGGCNSLWQILARPRFSRNPYRIGPGLYLCSASSPPWRRRSRDGGVPCCSCGTGRNLP